MDGLGSWFCPSPGIVCTVGFVAPDLIVVGFPFVCTALHWSWSWRGLGPMDEEGMMNTVKYSKGTSVVAVVVVMSVVGAVRLVRVEMTVLDET